MTFYFERIKKLNIDSLILDITSLCLEVLVAILLIVLYKNSAKLTEILQSKYLCFIGLVSYEWYLFHEFIRYITIQFYPRANGSLIVYLIISISPAVISFMLSVVIYKNISEPILTRSREKFPAPH
jgi:peptidoglycan/LPS O-acetylase OafA/YrhL